MYNVLSKGNNNGKSPIILWIYIWYCDDEMIELINIVIFPAHL